MRIRFPASVLGLLLAAACATGRHDAGRRAPDPAEVVRAFEADTAARDREDALYRAGLAYAAPASPAHDPDRAREVLARLVALHPGSEHRAVVDPLLALLRERERAEARERAAGAEIDSLRAEIGRMEGEISRLRARADLYGDLTRHFRTATQVRDERIRALERQLEELKRIDLRR